METSYDQHYIDARETLLDAVEALGPHSDAAILVGAQAVYVHTESVDDSFAVALFTYDADIGLDPERLEDSPAIVDAMSRAGFRLTDPPGTFRRDGGVPVDLLVPEAVGRGGRRAARLGVHGNKAARKAHGLEGALVSHARRRIASLDSDADRSCILKVAGPAALLVSKMHKIGERRTPGTVNNSSPRTPLTSIGLRAIDTAEMAEKFGLLRSHEISRNVASKALLIFQSIFGSRSDRGPELLVSYVGPLEPSAFIIESSIALS